MADLALSVLLFFAFLWLAVDLNNLTRMVAHMAIDVSKLTESEAALVAQVERLIGVVTASAQTVADLQQKLADAVAANDPAATAAVQAQLDTLAADMAAEAAKASAV